jgi:hypothetical protein
MFRFAGPLTIWFLCLVVVPGCVSVNGCVTSRHPLSNEDSSMTEKRLIGARVEAEESKQSEKDAKRAQKVGPDRIEAKPGSKVALVYKPAAEKTQDKEQEITILATKLGDRQYLSIGGRDEKKDHDEWFILQYEWKDDDSFRMRPMNVKAVGDDVRASRIKGRVEERQKKSGDSAKGSEGTHPSVELHEPTEQLREFIENGGDRLFEEKWIEFRRAKEE